MSLVVYPQSRSCARRVFVGCIHTSTTTAGDYYLPPSLNPIREYWISSMLFLFFRGLCMRPFVRSLADLTCPTVSGVSYWKVARPGQAKRDDVGLFVMVSNPFILSSQTAHTPTPSPRNLRTLYAFFWQSLSKYQRRLGPLVKHTLWSLCFLPLSLSPSFLSPFVHFHNIF